MVQYSLFFNHEREFAIHYCIIRTVVGDIRKTLCFRGVLLDVSLWVWEMNWKLEQICRSL